MGHTPHMGQNCYRRRTRDVIPFIPIQQSRVGAVLMYSRGNCHQSCMGRRVTCMQDLWGKKGKRTSVLQGPLVPYEPQQGRMQRSPSRLKFENKYTAKVVRGQKKSPQEWDKGLTSLQGTIFLSTTEGGRITILLTTMHKHCTGSPMGVGGAEIMPVLLFL